MIKLKVYLESEESGGETSENQPEVKLLNSSSQSVPGKIKKSSYESLAMTHCRDASSILRSEIFDLFSLHNPSLWNI